MPKVDVVSQRCRIKELTVKHPSYAQGPAALRRWREDGFTLLPVGIADRSQDAVGLGRLSSENPSEQVGRQVLPLRLVGDEIADDGVSCQVSPQDGIEPDTPSSSEPGLG